MRFCGGYMNIYSLDRNLERKVMALVSTVSIVEHNRYSSLDI